MDKNLPTVILVQLSETDMNNNIYNLADLGYMEIWVEPQRTTANIGHYDCQSSGHNQDRCGQTPS